MFSHRVIFHGRRVCHAKKAACGACGLARWCPSFGEGETNPVKAAKLIREPRAAPLLSGYRGEPPARLEALEDLALRLNRLADDLPEVRSLVLDPVLAGPDGIAVSGARIVLGPPPTREEGPRRLS